MFLQVVAFEHTKSLNKKNQDLQESPEPAGTPQLAPWSMERSVFFLRRNVFLKTVSVNGWTENLQEIQDNNW